MNQTTAQAMAIPRAILMSRMAWCVLSAPVTAMAAPIRLSSLAMTATVGCVRAWWRCLSRTTKVVAMTAAVVMATATLMPAGMAMATETPMATVTGMRMATPMGTGMAMRMATGMAITRDSGCSLTPEFSINRRGMM